MKVYRSSEGRKFPKTVVTVGVFDGLHLGHREILKKLKEKARELNAQTAVFTMFPHPKTVLRGKEEKCLMTQEEKIRAFEKAGTEHLIIYPFNREFASLTAYRFTEEILFKQLNTQCLVVGYDHRFGSDRLGDLDVLNSYARNFGFHAVQADKYTEDGVTVSSSVIRQLLSEGNIVSANRYLGYAYSLHGRVTEGDRIGRSIGYPTANLIIDQGKLLPANGVYSVEVRLENNTYFGMLNIGRRPTLNKPDEMRVEVHIFAYRGNLYGREIRLDIHRRIRDERRFDNLDDLKQQLQKDEAYCKTFFGLSN